MVSVTLEIDIVDLSSQITFKPAAIINSSIDSGIHRHHAQKVLFRQEVANVQTRGRDLSIHEHRALIVHKVTIDSQVA